MTEHIKRISVNNGLMGTLNETTTKSSDGQNEIDPVALQTELKTRMHYLQRLEKQGNYPNDIKKLKESLEATISELDRILADPDSLDLSQET